MKLTVLIITLLTTVHTSAAAPIDFIAEHYFPPDLVDAASEHVGLGEELHQNLHEHMAKEAQVDKLQAAERVLDSHAEVSLASNLPLSTLLLSVPMSKREH